MTTGTFLVGPDQATLTAIDALARAEMATQTAAQAGAPASPAVLPGLARPC